MSRGGREPAAEIQMRRIRTRRGREGACRIRLRSAATRVTSSTGSPDLPRKWEEGGSPLDLHGGGAATAGSSAGVDDDARGHRHGGGGAGSAIGEGAGAVAAWIHVPATRVSPPCAVVASMRASLP
jgi:hypothetical protein